MNIIERPLKNGKRFNNPKMIVVHAMGEYLETKEGMVFAPNFLESIGLSAHALIVPNGDVMMCRPERKGAYHARGFNTDSLGVEFLVKGVHNYGTFLEAIKTDYVTPEQYEAGHELIRKWVNDYSIETIVRHSDISPERKVDPGTGFKWDEFLEFI